MARTKTEHFYRMIEEDEATTIFNHLRCNIQWEEGIRSKSGPTRKAKSMDFGIDDILDYIIIKILAKLDVDTSSVRGIYLNYYRTGSDWTPNHSHPGMKQVVISLGADRVLTMGSKNYVMSNGDVIVFGSSIHGVPKDPNCTQGRISIALFVQK